jgi:hypothetical protein
MARKNYRSVRVASCTTPCLLTAVNLNITNSLVDARDVPSRVGRSSSVLAQGNVDVLLNSLARDVESQVLQLGVVREDDLETGSDTVVADQTLDDGAVLRNGEELSVSGRVGTKKERVDVGVGKVESEVLLSLVQESGGAQSGVGVGGRVGHGGVVHHVGPGQLGVAIERVPVSG